MPNVLLLAYRAADYGRSLARHVARGVMIGHTVEWTA
jgi:hypothetical protein